MGLNKAELIESIAAEAKISKADAKRALDAFVNNTTKCERDPRRGRRSFLTGDYERYAELYFTTHEPGGRYGNVTVRGNIFTSGPNAGHAITFAPGGDTILVTDNIFSGPVRDIPPSADCENVTIRENAGLEDKR